MCSYDLTPEFKWFSSTDRSQPAIGLHCRQLKDALPGADPTAWYRFWKLLRLVESLP